MKLYLKGHAYKYAAEQMLMTLFPGERPLYPQGRPTGAENALSLSLSQGKTWTTAHAVLLYGGGRYEGISRAPAAHTPDPLLADRTHQRILKTAFYRAGTKALGAEPPWGALTGVRPVKIPVRAMEAGATPKEAQAQLRTRYRVSAPRARLAMDCAAAALEAKALLAPDDVSLYLGIPFCPTRCAYCSFISSAVGENSRLMEPYLAALTREVAAAGAALRRAGKQVRSAYMGGGTPTTLSAPQLDRLLAAVEAAFDLTRCLEFTVEAGRPDTITAEKLAVLRRHGIDRISVNPQSLDERVLRAVGRAHSTADIFAAWDLVAQAGFPYVNMDLIAGLPADSAAGFCASLDGVLALGPENITVHTLALKKGSRLFDAPDALPGPAAVAAMLDYAWATLRAKGYRPYYLYRQKYMSGGFENIGWCRPGSESLYNIAMMEELHGILSLGAGGVTKLVHPSDGSLTRLVNPKYPKEYIERLPHIITEKEQLVWPIS